MVSATLLSWLSSVNNIAQFYEVSDLSDSAVSMTLWVWLIGFHGTTNFCLDGVNATTEFRLCNVSDTSAEVWFNGVKNPGKTDQMPNLSYSELIVIKLLRCWTYYTWNLSDTELIDNILLITSMWRALIYWSSSQCMLGLWHTVWGWEGGTSMWARFVANFITSRARRDWQSSGLEGKGTT